MHIAFVLPDLPTATGGLRAALRFAGYLQDAGHQVSIAGTGRGVRFGAADVSRFDKRTIRSLSKARNGDVVVVPEILAGSSWLTSLSGRVIVLNQNPFLTGPVSVDGAYLSMATLGVLATSTYTAEYLSQRYPQVRVERVTLGIDRNVFRPMARDDSKLTIAWMPRKRMEDANLVLAALQRHPPLRHWAFTEIDGVDLAGVAAVLGRAHVFLSFSEREGFGLPIAEAMATRSACVGFTGVGGREILTSTTGWPVPEADVVAFIGEVIQVCEQVQSGDAGLEAKLDTAERLIAGNYTPQIERTSLLASFQQLVAGPKP